MSLKIAAEASSDDAKEILQGKAYFWHEWSICRGRDCLYVWSESAALELSNGSNGWFRFIIDGKLATMYSSGSPENGNDNSGTFLFFYFHLTLQSPILATSIDHALSQPFLPLFCHFFVSYCDRNSFNVVYD